MQFGLRRQVSSRSSEGVEPELWLMWVVWYSCEYDPTESCATNFLEGGWCVRRAYEEAGHRAVGGGLGACLCWIRHGSIMDDEGVREAVFVT